MKIDRENFHIFWMTWKTLMSFSGMMWLIIKLKVISKPRFPALFERYVFDQTLTSFWVLKIYCLEIWFSIFGMIMMVCWSSLFIKGTWRACINSHFSGAFVFKTVRRFLKLLETIVLFNIINLIWWLTSCLVKVLLLCMCVRVCVCINVCIPF